MIPFDYPPDSHVRLHGPRGYRHHERYRPWLRDEFLFRCVYCLRREQWGLLTGSYHIDHFLPTANHPGRALNYDNFHYCCAACNLAKGDIELPNPEVALTSHSVNVYDDGKIEGSTFEAKRIIRKLGLDAAEYVEFRKLFIGIVRIVAATDGDEYFSLMRFPQDLPDLSRKRPPSNSRPNGIERSCFARRARGELPDTY